MDYQASVPYELDRAAVDELQEIVARLETLFEAKKFHTYEFGTGYALDVWQHVRSLFAWTKRKLAIPLDTRLKLTHIFSTACLESTEPVLVVRYGSACCALWKSKNARAELRQCKSIIDWSTMIRAVRNVVLLSPSASPTDLNGRTYEHRNETFASLVKNGSPQKIILALSRLFQCTVVPSKSIWDQLHDDVLSYLGPNIHDPKDTLVMEAFTALIPLGSSDSKDYIPLLFDLRHKVSRTLFYQCVVPVLADYVELTNEPAILSDEQIDIIFQAALDALDIPLMSTQATKSKIYTLQTSLTLGMSGSGGRLLKNASGSYNTKAHAVNSIAFAKILVNNLDQGMCRLEALINATSTFCHPSNSGPWSALITVTLSAITTEFSHRLYTRHDLDKQVIDRFVTVLRPLVLMGVHSHMPYVSHTSLDILRYLAMFSPDLVCPVVLSEVYPTLQHGLHQANRLASSIAVLSRLAVPLTSHLQYKMHLTTLLELALPNLDASDTKRCLLTFDLFQAVASVTVFEDRSDPVSISTASQVLPESVHALEAKEDLSLDDTILNTVIRGTSAAYPEILTFYMRRVFELLETVSEQRLGSAASASVLRVLLACSPPLFEKLLVIALEELSNPQQQNHDAFAQVCGSFVRANCALAFPEFWTILASGIKEEVLENTAGAGRVALPKDGNLLRNLSVLNMCLLACNSSVIVHYGAEIEELLLLLREHTGSSVVYTVANTLHHAIVALSGFNVVMPHPGKLEVEFPPSNIPLAVTRLSYLDLVWNIPTKESKNLAITLFNSNVDISVSNIVLNLGSVSKSVQSEDIVTNCLIFIRTALGAIAPLSDSVKEYRAKISDLLVKVYHELSVDDVSCLKEALFVAKVWACDVGYERTSSLDQHLSNLYEFEKKPFVVKGMQKRCLPPVILARRAQLYHHQRLALATQHRDAENDTIDLIIQVIAEACFSVYPAVRRNAFSALYSPLKIFNDSTLYTRVYDIILTKTDMALRNHEFEKAQGGIALLKYRSFGIQTVGRNPAFVRRFFEICSEAASADFLQLSTLATFVFFTMLPDICRLGASTSNDTHETAPRVYVDELIEHLVSTPFERLHWRDALFRSSTLLAVTQNPHFKPRHDLLDLFVDGSIIDHPKVRNIATFGALNIIQAIFRESIMPDLDLSMFRINAKLADYLGDKSTFENDWSQFYMQTLSQASGTSKSQLMQSCFVAPLGSQGWLQEPSFGVSRAPIHTLDLSGMISSLGSLTDPDRVRSLIKDLLAIRKLEPRPEQDRVSIVYALYYRDLITISAISSNRIMMGIKEVQQTDDMADRNWHRIAAEWVCGQLLAIPVLSSQVSEALVQDSLTTIGLAVENISPDTLVYWFSMISHVLCQVDFHRVIPVINYLEKQARATYEGGIKLSLKMALYTEALAVLQWHRPALLELAPQWGVFNHSLQTTRESCGDELSIAACGSLRPHSGPLKLGEKELSVLQEVFDNRDLAKGTLSLLHLLLRLLQLLGGESCLDLLLSRGIPLLLECSSIRDDPEILALVTNAFQELSNCHFTPESALRISIYLMKTMRESHASQWHLRIRLLLFLQPFYFIHLMILKPSTRQELTLLVVDTLSDPQVEVRDLAADTLSGIVRCSPPSEQEKFVALFDSQFRSKVGIEIELPKRHAAVLGLGALIGAFPYKSPPPLWVPDILATIAILAAGDNGIVGKSTKKILSDFKKTRQDTWHIDQTIFTQDQLDDLDGVLWRNYFA